MLPTLCLSDFAFSLSTYVTKPRNIFVCVNINVCVCACFLPVTLRNSFICMYVWQAQPAENNAIVVASDAVHFCTLFMPASGQQ